MDVSRWVQSLRAGCKMEYRQSNRPQAIFQYIHYDLELNEDQSLQYCFYTLFSTSYSIMILN